MISLTDYILQKLNEGKVDGLKNVSTIRHYTTFAALKSILSKGYIEARESKGDEDWEDYNLGEKKVVSFHDLRTDPEWDNILRYNKDKMSLDGKTQTLGLHGDKVCACIEIDFDKLDKIIQDKAHLLNIYGQKADEFVNFWNSHVKWMADNKLPITAKIKLLNEGINKLISLIKDNNEEITKVVKQMLNEDYYRSKVLESENGNLLLKELIDIFKKYYSDSQLDEDTETEWGSSAPLRYALIYRILDKFKEKFGKDFKENLLKPLEITDSDKLMIEIVNQKNYKEYSEDERKELIEAVKNFDLLKVVKMVTRHGWSKGDIKKYRKANYFVFARRVQLNNNIYGDATLLFWMDSLMENKDRIINGDVEIRIPANVEINKENCKIIIFDGIAEAIKQKTELPQKYYKQYNIEHLK